MRALDTTGHRVYLVGTKIFFQVLIYYHPYFTKRKKKPQDPCSLQDPLSMS